MDTQGAHIRMRGEGPWGRSPYSLAKSPNANELYARVRPRLKPAPLGPQCREACCLYAELMMEPAASGRPFEELS
eukprot:460508-Pyramimonas_sp.AAC.1